MRRSISLALLLLLAGCGGRDVAGTSGAARLEVETTAAFPEESRVETTRLFGPVEAPRLNALLAPDGTGTIVAVLGDELVAYDVASGEWTDLVTADGLRALADVPGGDSVLAVADGRLLEVPLDGSEAIVVYEAPAVMFHLSGPVPPGYLFIEDEAADGSRGLLVYDTTSGSITELDRTDDGHFGSETWPFGIVGTREIAVYLSAPAPNAQRRVLATPVAGGDPVDITPPMVVSVRSVAVTEDGATALISGRDASRSVHLFAAPLSGEPGRLLTGGIVTDESVVVTTLPDGTGSSSIGVGPFFLAGDLVYVALEAAGVPVSVHAIPLSGGESTEIIAKGSGTVVFKELASGGVATSAGGTVLLTPGGAIPVDVPGPADVLGSTDDELLLHKERTVYAVDAGGAVRTVATGFDRRPRLRRSTLVGTADGRIVASDVAGGGLVDIGSLDAGDSLLTVDVLGDDSAIVFAVGKLGAAYATIEQVFIAPLR